MSALVIEHGVPIPDEREGTTATLRRLGVGDSVVFPNAMRNDSANMVVAANRLGIKVVTRKVEGGRRVWRVK